MDIQTKSMMKILGGSQQNASKVNLINGGNARRIYSSSFIVFRFKLPQGLHISNKKSLINYKFLTSHKIMSSSADHPPFFPSEFKYVYHL